MSIISLISSLTLLIPVFGVVVVIIVIDIKRKNFNKEDFYKSGNYASKDEIEETLRESGYTDEDIRRYWTEK